MRFASTVSYPRDAGQVSRLYASADFARAKLEATTARQIDVTVTHDGESFTVTTQGQLPSTVVPESFRGFVGEQIGVRLVEAWGPPGPDGSRRSAFTLTFDGVPVQARGSQQLAPTPGGCEVRYEGEVKASIPLFGRRVEQTAVAAVEQVVETERTIGLEHLAGL